MSAEVGTSLAVLADSDYGFEHSGWSLAQVLLDAGSAPENQHSVFRLMAFDADTSRAPSWRRSLPETLISAAGEAGLGESPELARLREIAQFRASLPEHDHSVDGPSPAFKPKAEDGPDWAKLIGEGPFTTPDAINNAIASATRNEQRIGFRDPLDHMRSTVGVDERVAFLDALVLASAVELHSVMFAIERASETWRESAAVQDALPRLGKAIVQERSSEILATSWGISGDVNRLVEVCKLERSEAIESLVTSATHSLDTLSSESLYECSRLYAETVPPEGRRDALLYEVARVDKILEKGAGDGEWAEALSPPPDLSEAVALFLWNRLGSPDAIVRWRATHSVRRLLSLGCSEVVDELVKCGRDATAFRDATLPPYTMHSKLFLLIAMARAALEAPENVAAYQQWLIDVAQDQEFPHVLMRHFAKEAVLAVESKLPGTVPVAALGAVKAVNQSPHSPQKKDHKKHADWNWGRRGPDGESRGRFHFEYDVERYWYGALADVFEIPGSEVSDRAEVWILDKWGIADDAWTAKADPRLARGILPDRSTGHSHGSYPRVDRHSFYLEYHAMFCAAGELLAAHPVVNDDWHDDAWHEWLSRHTLTLDSGEWLADRRGATPLQLSIHPEGLRVVELEPSNRDFETALGLCEARPPQTLVAWGNWTRDDGALKEEVTVHSALVSSSTADAPPARAPDRSKLHGLPSAISGR